MVEFCHSIQLNQYYFSLFLLLSARIYIYVLAIFLFSLLYPYFWLLAPDCYALQFLYLFLNIFISHYIQKIYKFFVLPPYFDILFYSTLMLFHVVFSHNLVINAAENISACHNCIPWQRWIFRLVFRNDCFGL